jgi:hypothetical protein
MKTLKKTFTDITRTPRIRVWVGFSILIILIIGITLPVIEGNGLQHYSGAQRRAAEIALDFDKSAYSPGFSLPWQHVSEVPLAEPGAARPGVRCTSDPSNPQSYLVTISRVWIFGLRFSTQHFDACGLSA